MFFRQRDINSVMWMAAELTEDVLEQRLFARAGVPELAYQLNRRRQQRRLTTILART